MNIIILHGPNLNLIGSTSSRIGQRITLDKINTGIRRHVRKMDIEFNTLLDQLPKETRVSELVEGINMTGVGSNIRFQDISVEPEIENEFFIEQPIRIAALGEYHQFGSFISGLAALPRIITMHDFEVSNPQPTLEAIPELNLILQTKTYRSKEVTPDEEAADD